MYCLVLLYSFASTYLIFSLLGNRIVRQSVNYFQKELPFGVDASSKFQRRTKAIRILLWTDYYRNEASLKAYCVSENSLKNCAYTKCDFTTDRRLLNSSDAIVFHGRNLNKHELPHHRSSKQIWIFFMLEAPVHTFIDLGPFDSNVFNMTMTYRPDSDVYIPYGRLVQLNRSDSRHYDNQQRDLSSAGKIKKRLVAWAVSNCQFTPSHRGEKVTELRKYITVDIYGKCGNLSCTPISDSPCDAGLECHQYLGSKYKFYLAFENALCQDYITEKLYHSLYVGMVPIVYGLGDYSRVAPKGSYIDAADFPTMKSLANYLLHLDRRPSEYEKYFEWRKDFLVQVSFFQDAWCSLCTML